eukprot:c12839_g1_i1 orf=538-2064(+)
MDQAGKVEGRNTSKNSDYRSEKTEQRVVHPAGRSKYPALKDIAVEPIDKVVGWMRGQPDELSEDLKAELREILNGNGGIQHREEFALLQRFVLNRKDLSPDSLMHANRAQLEILVAIKTGIQAFLHPDISVTQSSLIEVFFCKRCRNVACQNLLPGDGCKCGVCCENMGFCNACMCTICSKFDFDVNTCRWVGCDVCSHWTHTDCAIRVGQIAMGTSVKGVGRNPEMLFKCKACKHTSELLGWVKDVFCACACDWEKEVLMKEFDCVRRIFHGSKDSKGRQLFWKSEELLERLKEGLDDGTACNEMQQFFRELEKDDVNGFGGEHAKLIEPHEACARITEVVHEAVTKMETVAGEKVRSLKRARATLEAFDKELEKKKRELQDLQFEREVRKLEIEELRLRVKLKVAEADMFQTRADDARREAESLQCLVENKSVEAEEHFKDLKLQLDEVEAQRHALFEKIQLQECSQQQPDPSQMLMLCKIQDVLKWVPCKEAAELTKLSKPPSSC